jgi:hypothetical protein
MKPSWLSNFRQYLDRQAPILEMDGYGQSRKVNDFGWYDAQEEIRCFASIHYYFQMGLGKQDRRIEEVLNVIHQYQKDNGRGAYTANFYPFGLIDDNLTNRKTKQLAPHTKMAPFSQGICELSGTTQTEDTATIRVLGPAEQEDFLVFFCRIRSVILNINMAQRYGRVKDRCAWFFLSGAEPQWEPGTRFRPAIEELPPPQAS